MVGEVVGVPGGRLADGVDDVELGRRAPQILPAPPGYPGGAVEGTSEWYDGGLVAFELSTDAEVLIEEFAAPLPEDLRFQEAVDGLLRGTTLGL